MEALGKRIGEIKVLRSGLVSFLYSDPLRVGLLDFGVGRQQEGYC